MDEDIRALKDALENLNTRKSTSRRILTGILSKNSEKSELKPNLSPNLLREWIGRSIRSKINMSKIHDCECNSSPMILNGILVKLGQTLPLSSPREFPTPETIRGMGTSFRRTFGFSSVTYDWLMVALNTIDQS